MNVLKFLPAVGFFILTTQVSFADDVVAMGKLIDKQTRDSITTECLKYNIEKDAHGGEKQICTVFQFVKYDAGREDLKTVLSEPIDLDAFLSALENTDQYVGKDRPKLKDSLISVSKWAYSKEWFLMPATVLATFGGFSYFAILVAPVLWPIPAGMLAVAGLPAIVDLAKAPVVLMYRPIANAVESISEKRLQEDFIEFKQSEDVEISHKRFKKIENGLRKNY